MGFAMVGDLETYNAFMDILTSGEQEIAIRFKRAVESSGVIFRNEVPVVL